MGATRESQAQDEGRAPGSVPHLRAQDATVSRDALSHPEFKPTLDFVLRRSLNNTSTDRPPQPIRNLRLWTHSYSGIPALYLFWFLIQLPFLSSALRIDEPYYVWVAEHIGQFPWDPYGAKINWYGSPQTVFETLPNPTLVPYCLAVWQKLFSFSEISVHLFALAWSFVALHGFGRIAASFEINRLCALFLLLCSPAFYLGSQVAFLDVPMLALLLLAVAYAVDYQREGKTVAFVIALVSSFLCPLAKYSGIPLFALIGWLALSGKRRNGMILIAMAPVFSVFLWNLFCWQVYGEFHWSAVRRFQAIYGKEFPLVTAVGILARFGLGVLPFALIAALPVIRLRTLSVVALSSLGFLLLGRQIGLGWVPSLLLATSGTVAVHALLGIAATGYRSIRTRDQVGMFLAVWVMAGFLLQFGMPNTSVRYLLPLVPPVILILLRISSWTNPSPSFLAVGAANVLLVTSIALGDSAIADGYREVVQNVVVPQLESNNGNLYFSGHWGFQYYAQLAGGHVIDKKQEPQYREGDLILLPTTGIPDVKALRISTGLQTTVSTVSYTPSWSVRTVDARMSANFYGSWTAGASTPTLLPFGISTGPSDTFRLYRVSGIKR